MLVTTMNPGLLPSRSQIRQVRAESGLGRIWDHDTGNRERYNLTYTSETRNLRLLGTFGGLSDGMLGNGASNCLQLGRPERDGDCQGETAEGGVLSAGRE